MKYLKQYLKMYRKEAVTAPLFKLLEATFDLLVPIVVASLIDRGIGNGNPNMKHLVISALILAGLGLVGFLAAVTAQWFAARAAMGTATGLRKALFTKVTSLSFAQIDELSTSTLLTRMTSDVNQVQSGVNLFLRLFLRSPFIVFGSLVCAILIDPKISLIFLGVIFLLSAVVFSIMRITYPLHKKVQKQLDTVTGKTRETLNGVRVLRAFGKEEEEIREFKEANDALAKKQRFVGRISALMNPLTYVLINFGVIFLLYTGAIRVESGDLSQGQIVALYNYLSQILIELVKLANLIVTLTKAMACSSRVGAVLDITPDTLNEEGVKEGKPHACRIEADRVSLRYPGSGEDTLENISFRVEPGESLGIIGGTGAGKSSLVNLIPRFYDVTGGTLSVDGVDVRDWNTEALRDKIGIVMQNPVLFSGTVRENLAFSAPGATDGDMWEAVAAAQMEPTLKEKNGLDTYIEEKGRNISGGQRQRLAIARALVKKPDILILDDASSALDYMTDSKLRQAIGELSYHPTVIAVSQRTASLRELDRILVLDDGKEVGYGTHKDLLSTSTVYREIHESQYGKEEE